MKWAWTRLSNTIYWASTSYSTKVRTPGRESTWKADQFIAGGESWAKELWHAIVPRGRARNDGILWSSLPGFDQGKEGVGVIQLWDHRCRQHCENTLILWIQANRPASRKSELFLYYHRSLQPTYLEVYFDARASHDISGCPQSAQISLPRRKVTPPRCFSIQHHYSGTGQR
jgi:hypothetical protein